MIRIEPLTERTLEQAVGLLTQIFPGEEEEAPGDELPASLYPEKYKNFLLKTQMSNLRYWVAIDDSGRIVGTTGLYCYEDDREEAFWLGWFCVHSKARKKGTGAKLLRFSINEARQGGKKFLRVYTTTDLKDAIKLYKKHGFKVFKEEPWKGTNLKVLYYELKL